MGFDIEAVRSRLRQELPDRIASAAASYDGFAAETAPSDAKGFAAHHAACRAALAHMDLLVRLTRWAAGSEAADDDEPDALLAEARAALDEDS